MGAVINHLSFCTRFHVNANQCCWIMVNLNEQRAVAAEIKDDYLLLVLLKNWSAKVQYSNGGICVLQVEISFDKSTICFASLPLTMYLTRQFSSKGRCMIQYDNFHAYSSLKKATAGPLMIVVGGNCAHAASNERPHWSCAWHLLSLLDQPLLNIVLAQLFQVRSDHLATCCVVVVQPINFFVR